MTHNVEDLWRMYQQAAGMPFGAGQIAAVEQLIRHADVADDPHLAFAARMLATHAYVYGGEPAKSFVTFSWCLSDFDRNPGPYHQRHLHRLLWHFKYMVNALLRFPEVPLERTYLVLDDMERRYRDGGHSLQAVYKHRYLVAEHVGARDEADEWYQRWITTPRDDLSDCAGCDPTAQAHYLARRGRDEEAVALGEPVLAGQLTCLEQPQGILTALLLPYLRTGRREQARDAHRRAYRLLRGNLADLADIGDHLQFCAVTGNDARGLEIVERHLEWLDRAPSPAAAMDFAASAALILRRLDEAGHGDMTVHRRAYGDRPATDVPVSALAAELAALATDLAARFDARNGTSAQSERIARRMVAEPIGEYLPLSATIRRRPMVPTPRPGEVAQETVPATPRRAPARPAAGSSGTSPDVPFDIPADATAERLLALAEEYELTDRVDAWAAVLREFDNRFGGVDLVTPLAALRTEFRGQERYLADDLAGAEELWRQAEQLYRAAGDPARAWSVSGRIGVLRCMQGNGDEGFAAVEQAAMMVAEYGDSRRLAAAQARIGLSHLIQERFAAALDAYHQAAATLTDAFGDPFAAEPAVAHLAARIELMRAHVLRELNRPEECRAAAETARDAYRRLGVREQVAVAAMIYAQSLDDPATAVEAFDEAVLHAADDQVAVNARLGRARALVATERFPEAIDDFVEVVGICTERGVEDGAAMTRLELAHAYHRAGRALEAAEAGEEALVGLTRLGIQAEADRCRHLLANVYISLGEHESALEMLDQLATNLDGPDNLPARGQVLEEAGDLLYHLDRDVVAAQRFAAAADAYRLAGLHLDQLRASRRRAVSLHWAGEPVNAIEALEEADKVAAGLPAEVAGEPVAVWERAMLGYDAARILIGAEQLETALARISEVPDQFRSIEAFSEALQADLLHGEVLLRIERPGEAEPVLRSALAGLPRDSGAVGQAAWLLARALSDLGRDAEAEALRAEYGLEDD